jgi:hypothetical protein
MNLEEFNKAIKLVNEQKDKMDDIFINKLRFKNKCFSDEEIPELIITNSQEHSIREFGRYSVKALGSHGYRMSKGKSVCISDDRSDYIQVSYPHNTGVSNALKVEYFEEGGDELIREDALKYLKYQQDSKKEFVKNRIKQDKEYRRKQWVKLNKEFG